MKPKTIELNPGDRVVWVRPETCSGPGWRNKVVWVYVVTNDGKLREEAIQQDECTAEMLTLFDAGEAMAVALMSALPTAQREERKV